MSETNAAHIHTQLIPDILVDSESIYIETFRLNESNHRELEEYNENNERLEIKAIEESIFLSEIYDAVKMEGRDERKEAA